VHIFFYLCASSTISIIIIIIIIIIITAFDVLILKIGEILHRCGVLWTIQICTTIG